MVCDREAAEDDAITAWTGALEKRVSHALPNAAKVGDEIAHALPERDGSRMHTAQIGRMM